MKIRRKQRLARTHAFPWALVVAFVAMVFCGGAAMQGLSAMIDDWTSDLPNVRESADAFAYSQKTRIYANDGETLLAEFYLQDQEPVEINQVSEYVLYGTVATEDERFYSHAGVDPAGITRALIVNMLGGELEGASTITQQLVRNTLLSDEAHDISLRRKLREAALAIQMEDVYSKDEILMMYMNTINYGNGCYGIEAAAKYYFSTSASNLSLVQAATLVGIPQSPTFNNPIDYPDACVARRNLVLDRMLSNGFITKEEHDATRIEPLILNVAERDSADGIHMFPYFTSYVRQVLMDELSYEEVFNGGLTVVTTIDPKLQQMAEEAVASVKPTMALTNDNDVKMSLTSVDPNTGYIVAMVGGEDYSQSEFNLATDAERQTGSSFKTYTLLAAIEQGINPQSLLNCTGNFEYNGWKVENYGGANYGVRSMASAIAISSNTGFARLVTQEDGITPASVLEMANRLGVKGDNGFGAYPAITLGVAQTNTLSMASGYGCIAAEGMRYKATPLITVKKGNETIVDNTKPEGEKVLDPKVAYAATRVLEGVVNGGTAAGYALSNGQPSAGKTGTSEEWRDLWYVAFTPQLSTAVWAGADPERQMWEANWCKAAWKAYMDAALADTPVKQWTVYPDPEYNKVLSMGSYDPSKDLNGDGVIDDKDDKIREEREKKEKEDAKNKNKNTKVDEAATEAEPETEEAPEAES